MHEQIDENLRRVYEQAQSEEVPDRFTSLLDQLKQQEQAASRDEKNGSGH